MTVGAVTMACLLLVSGQVSDDVYKTNQRNHRIPIDLQPARRPEIRELLLFVSNDLGKNWQQVAAVPPDRDHFVFYAPADGTYWFRVAAVNKQNKQDPEDVFKGAPDLKMLIDTLKPSFKIVSAQRQGDELVVAWEAQDAHLDANSLKVEYQSADASPPIWQSMPAAFGPTGQVRARLSSAAAVSVRAEIRDQAGNVSQVQAEVPAAVAAASFTQKSPGSPPMPLPTPAAALPPSTNAQVELAPKGVIPPVLSEQPSTTTVGSSPIASVPPFPERITRPEEPLVPATSSVNAVLQDNKMPQMQFVNDYAVTLQYKLDKIGPSGVGKVEVWLTQDGGKTWKPFVYEDELPAPDAEGKYTQVLELPKGEGVYGLSLVVKSKVGLGKAAPGPGDAPEMMIEVDVTKPTAQLFSPVPAPDRRDAVILTWKAADRNLTEMPITLEWAERDVGPWQPIAANLPNTGRYSWPMPHRIPEKVFLRIRVRDKANNEYIAVTAQPQPLDLSEPVGQLIRVAPVRRD